MPKERFSYQKALLELRGMLNVGYAVEDINNWSTSKGIDKADYRDQWLQLSEELGELSKELKKGDKQGIKVELGDVMVTLIILHQQLGLTLEETLTEAHNKNTVRLGKLVDGKYFKEEDLLTYFKVDND